MAKYDSDDAGKDLIQALKDETEAKALMKKRHYPRAALLYRKASDAYQRASKISGFERHSQSAKFAEVQAKTCEANARDKTTDEGTDAMKGLKGWAASK